MRAEGPAGGSPPRALPAFWLAAARGGPGRRAPRRAFARSKGALHFQAGIAVRTCSGLFPGFPSLCLNLYYMLVGSTVNVIACAYVM